MQQLREELERTREQLEGYKNTVDSIFASNSWRVTEPLRRLQDSNRRGRAKVRKLRRAVRTRPRVTRQWAGLTAPANSRLTPVEATKPPRSESWLTSEARIGVVCHVYYSEVWPDLAGALAMIEQPFDLFVTVVEDASESISDDIKHDFPQALVRVVPNRGRDIGPLFAVLEDMPLDQYTAVLKIHGKRSPHRGDGDAWRQEIVGDLMPDADGIRRIVTAFAQDPNLGIVGPSKHVLGREFWGSNRPLVDELASRVPLAYDAQEISFVAGSMFWIKPFLLRRLLDLRLTQDDFEPESGAIDGSLPHAVERFFGVLAEAAGTRVVEADTLGKASALPARIRPKTYAFYLPQFHRIAENDRWWGEGFTDWRSSSSAAPLFTGHQQPNLPSELGSYDLATAGVMSTQARLAREYGIDGFIVHHYWFDGKPLLDTPIKNVLADPAVDFPFALCWANEAWTRRWDGLAHDVLQPQSYSPGWEKAFYADIRPALGDPRYIRIDGKPLLVIYRLGQFPNPAEAVAYWREKASQDGLGGLHILAVLPNSDFEGLPAGCEQYVDGFVTFPPGSGLALQRVSMTEGPSSESAGSDGPTTYCYPAAALGKVPKTLRGTPVHPGVFPGWDNTPRRGRAGFVFHGANPASFRRWLTAADTSNGMLFINAWNEWAEGAVLEPNQRYGRGNLEAVRDAWR